MIEYLPMSGAALDDLKTRLMAPVEAVPMPWPMWNEVCRGFGGQVGVALGWHVLVAGKSGGGKTFTGQNIAAAAVRAGESATIHSLEMDRVELNVRMMAMVSGLPAWKLAPGKYFCPATFDQAREEVELARGTVRVNDTPMYKLSDILDGIRRNYEKHGSRLHVVDYLQLAWDGDAASRYERITTVSHHIRQLAKELKVVTVGLSQLNRDGSKGGKPQKEAMDGGGPLEADADQVLLLDHSRQVAAINSEGRNRGWIGWAILDKNRHGPSVEIPIRFDSDSFRIRERLPDEIMPNEVKP